MKKLSISAILAVIFLLIWASCAAPTGSTIEIGEALDGGMVTADCSGNGLDSVRVEVTRLTDEGFVLLIPSGTYFISSGEVQDMVVTVETTINLVKKTSAGEWITSACANLEKDAPGSSDKFSIAPDPPILGLKELITLMESQSVSLVVKQVAVWIVTDNPTRHDLNVRYVSAIPGRPYEQEPAASDDDVIDAMILVQQAGIDLSTRQIFTERESLLLGLGSADATVCQFASQSLGGGESFEILIAALTDDNVRIRRAAIKSLGNLGDPRAIGLLEELILTEEDTWNQEAIEEALEKLVSSD